MTRLGSLASVDVTGGLLATETELMAELVRGGVRSVSENGVLGDPLQASAQAGQELLKDAVSQVVRFVQEWPTGAGTAR